MADWLASGRLVEAILVLIVLEGLVFVVFRRMTGRGPDPLRLAPNLLSGFCLLLALRSALVGSGWVWVAAPLTGALIAHVIDVTSRWPR